jgi:hypothetical protein
MRKVTVLAGKVSLYRTFEITKGACATAKIVQHEICTAGVQATAYMCPCQYFGRVPQTQYGQE